MNRIATALAAVSFAFAATLAQAQTPSPAKPDRGQMRESMKAAHEACKDKPDRRACMTEQYCAKSANPAECHAKAKERHAKMSQRMDERQKAHEACTGKRGDELSTCLRDKLPRSEHGRHHRMKG